MQGVKKNQNHIPLTSFSLESSMIIYPPDGTIRLLFARNVNHIKLFGIERYKPQSEFI